MLPTTDTGVIELYLTNHLKRKDARQFELRLLRDATFLEKVFMHKARTGDLISSDDFAQQIKAKSKRKKSE